MEVRNEKFPFVSMSANGHLCPMLNSQKQNFVAWFHKVSERSNLGFALKNGTLIRIDFQGVIKIKVNSVISQNIRASIYNPK